MSFRTLLPALCLLFSLQASAVNLRVHGTVTDLLARTPLQNVEVRVYKDGMKQYIITTGLNGSFSVVLDNNADYVIRFVQAGRVTKCFGISTVGGVWEEDHRTVDLEVEMTLFAPVEGLDLTWFDMPMGMARFMPMTGHVSWSADYERRIRGEADRLMAEVIRRHQELGTQANVLDLRQRP